MKNVLFVILTLGFTCNAFATSKCESLSSVPLDLISNFDVIEKLNDLKNNRGIENNRMDLFYCPISANMAKYIFQHTGYEKPSPGHQNSHSAHFVVEAEVHEGPAISVLEVSAVMGGTFDCSSSLNKVKK